jgi:SnoaL-like domain
MIHQIAGIREREDAGNVGMTYQQETTLETVANRLAIGDLTASYNRALESGDLETWIGTFVQEGVLEAPGGESFAGHRELARYFRSRAPDRVHLTTDAQVEVDGVHASQECRVLTLGPGPAVEAVGQCRDSLIYERGRWYFVRRQLVSS